jgi:hypothetical protein
MSSYLSIDPSAYPFIPQYGRDVLPKEERPGIGNRIGYRVPCTWKGFS